MLKEAKFLKLSEKTIPKDIKLEKLVLKGHFQISEKLRQKEKEDLTKLNQITKEMKKILYFKHQKFDFEINMLYFNPYSAIFIARGDDVFGESVIYGNISEYKSPQEKIMEFKKIYFGEPKHKFSVRRADSVDYFGFMNISKKKINCSGRYEVRSEAGQWRLSSKI